ncbi:MAG: Stp1/IreP family PP2C-type Ser/Thr phosphatase [Ruminococcaceae bacterium]|nr:Stp1/IreP family PP2C-type Ser/Thr phosphatase [Oscillospiraceae bacterium]
MQYWGITDLGCVREQNQDIYQIENLGKDAVLCVVCDGMGGAKAGNVASMLAAEVFVEEVRKNWKNDMDQTQINHLLRSATKEANFRVYDHAQQHRECAGMGTTLVAALIKDKDAAIVNVGDSRAYHIRGNGIQKITVDHSLVEMMVLRGEITSEEAKTYPGKNYITRAIGTETFAEADLFHVDMEKGEYMLLCSDGLSNLMDDQELLFEVVHGENKALCCEALLNTAKDRGAPDNVTCVLVQL